MAGCCDPSKKEFCLFNIPICGGFCAPTVSNEKSCFRHFSNEFTLPAAPKFAKLLPCIEQNPCCIWFGKFGCACADRSRKAIMMTGCSFNCLALLLLVVSTIGGLATKPATLEKLSWVRGTGTTSMDVYMNLMTVHNSLGCMDPGMRAMFLSQPMSHTWTENSQGCFTKDFNWDDANACANSYPEINALCEDCKNARLSTSTLFLSIFTQLPTIATNLQRATRFGDVNCQATFGVITNLFSLLSSMASLVAFKTSCMQDLPTSYRGVSMTWEMGLGFRMLLAATVIKVIDIICHCVVPTPRQRWAKAGPEIETTADYLGLAPAVREEEEPSPGGNA